MTQAKAPIFIVGAPRSGTTLLATLLASHSHISCGPETHFFPYLEANYQNLSLVLNAADWPQTATEFISELTLAGYRVHNLFSVTKDALYAYLATRRPSLQALLESLTVQQMRAVNKTRWAEKTPNHLLHLATMRQLYPRSPILRIVRDPRDVAASIATKLPWASDSLMENAYLIDEWHRKSTDFCRQDPLTYTLRYENLVCQPQDTLQKLCAFIEEPYEPNMLATPAAAQYTAPAHEFWKNQVSQELDANRCYAWQQGPLDITHTIVSLICEEAIAQFGYQPLSSPLSPISAHHLSYRFVRACSDDLQYLLKQGSLLVACSPQTVTRGARILYCDVPINGTNRVKSWHRLRIFLRELVMLRCRGVNLQFTQFCCRPDVDKNVFGRIAAHCLRLLGTPTRLFIQTGMNEAKKSCDEFSNTYRKVEEIPLPLIAAPMV